MRKKKTSTTQQTKHIISSWHERRREKEAGKKWDKQNTYNVMVEMKYSQIINNVNKYKWTNFSS